MLTIGYVTIVVKVTGINECQINDRSSSCNINGPTK
jgi:hypothetical protein